MKSVWASACRAALAIGATTALLGCAPEQTPTALIGTWYSDDERFDGRTLEIDPEWIRFMQGQQELGAIRVRATTQEGSGEGPIHYEIEGVDRDGQDTTLSFEMSLRPHAAASDGDATRAVAAHAPRRRIEDTTRAVAARAGRHRFGRGDMSRRSTGHELKSFGIHLILASVAFAMVLALGVGALTLARWAFPLELASSSPQKVYEASGRILELHARFWPVTLVSLIGVALAAGWLGRRITGPLVRFMSVFQRLAAGEFPEPVRLRTSDYLAHEADALNELIAALKARAVERTRSQGEVLATLEELNERIRESGSSNLTELSERALEQMKALDGSSS